MQWLKGWVLEKGQTESKYKLELNLHSWYLPKIVAKGIIKTIAKLILNFNLVERWDGYCHTQPNLEFNLTWILANPHLQVGPRSGMIM